MPWASPWARSASAASSKTFAWPTHPGEYVVVHAGFAISVVDEQEAMEVFKMLEQMDELTELDILQPA